MTLQQKFAANLKKVRLSKKLSQDSLARKAGVCVSYVSMLERGNRSPPLDTLEAISSALGVKPAALLS